MTLREKQRLRRIVRSNAEEYRTARRNLVMVVMRGFTAPDARIDVAQRDLPFRAMAIAVAVAVLEAHAEVDP